MFGRLLTSEADVNYFVGNSFERTRAFRSDGLMPWRLKRRGPMQKKKWVAIVAGLGLVALIFPRTERGATPQLPFLRSVPVVAQAGEFVEVCSFQFGISAAQDDSRVPEHQATIMDATTGATLAQVNIASPGGCTQWQVPADATTSAGPGAVVVAMVTPLPVPNCPTCILLTQPGLVASLTVFTSVANPGAAVEAATRTNIRTVPLNHFATDQCTL
jgi:hypothetical protein